MDDMKNDATNEILCVGVNQKVVNYSPYISAKEVARVLNKSKSSAYRIIKELNDELLEKGFKVTSGRVSREYFEERFYGVKGGNYA